MEPWLSELDAVNRVVWVAAFYVVCTLVGVGTGFGLERMLGNRRIWSEAVPPGQFAHELRGNLVFLAVVVLGSTAALEPSVIRFGTPSILRSVATFVALNFGFQLHFYVLHRLLHLPALVRFHRHHHVSILTTPLSGQSTSMVEALGWTLGYVGLPILFSRLEPIGFAGVVAYQAYNVIGNIVGHANVEVVPPAPGLRQRSLLATVFTYHALHHLRWNGHYGFASTWCDRLFGTEWPDWIPLYERVAAGRALALAETREVGRTAESAPPA